MERVSWQPSDGLEPMLSRAEAMLASPRRQLLGIAGAPASGKSTLSEGLLAELGRRHPGQVVGVGMDAFHLGHQILRQRGQVEVKGAPHTFDGDGYVALLERVRVARETVYAPEFHREIEDSLAASVEISPEVRLVVTEGNYLLLPQPPWDRVRRLLDQAWFVFLDDDERRRRMLARHQRYGHSPEAARTRTYGSDETNAQLVNAAQNNPDLWLEQLA